MHFNRRLFRGWIHLRSQPTYHVIKVLVVNSPLTCWQYLRYSCQINIYEKHAISIAASIQFLLQFNQTSLISRDCFTVWSADYFKFPIPLVASGAPRQINVIGLLRPGTSSKFTFLVIVLIFVIHGAQSWILLLFTSPFYLVVPCLRTAACKSQLVLKVITLYFQVTTK